MIGDKQKAWEALEKAIRLVGAASETADMPDALRGELMTALAALVWVSQSIRCPTCGRWYPSYLQRRDRAKGLHTPAGGALGSVGRSDTPQQTDHA